MRSDKVKKVPLRHQCEKFAVCGKPGQVPDLHRMVTNPCGDFPHLLVRTLKKVVEQAEFVHQFERRGMNGVTPKIAEKIRVLLQHHDINTCTGEQKGKHHSSGTSARNAAFGFEGSRHR